MACGCPVVATDCPSGPREILSDRKCGLLAPVGDPEALARTMEDALMQPWDSGSLRRHAAEYSSHASADQYLDALEYPLRDVSPMPCAFDESASRRAAS
jgi:glycosyltransferase involved in cell wall biosynthesis